MSRRSSLITILPFLSVVVVLYNLLVLGSGNMNAVSSDGMKAVAGPCRIDRVTLYESRRSPGGPAYAALANAQLRP